MMEDLILSQALWLLSVPEAAARVHGQHARGRISITEANLRSSRKCSTFMSPGMLVGRLLTEAIVFARNAITRFANSDRSDATAPSPLAFSESLMQSQQDVLPALSAFQRALKASTEVNEIPDSYDPSDASDFVDKTDESAARAGIAACHILLSIGHSDPRDAASSASDALRGLSGALRASAAAAAATEDGTSSGGPILHDLSLGSAPCQVCLLVMLVHNLDRLQRISASQIVVCRRETVSVIKLLEELTSLASGGTTAADSAGSGGSTAAGGVGGGVGIGGRLSLVVQISDREPTRPRKLDADDNGAAAAAAASRADDRGLFLKALREIGIELRQCLQSSRSENAAAAALETALRAAHRRVTEELQRVGVSTCPEWEDEGAFAATAIRGTRLGGLSHGILQPSRGESRNSSRSSSRSGGGAAAGGASRRSGATSQGVAGLRTSGDGRGGGGGGYGGSGGRGLLLVNSDGLERRTCGSAIEDDDVVAAAAMAAADTASATAKWLRQLTPVQSDSSDRTSASLASSLSLSIPATITDLNPGLLASQPSAPPRIVSLPFTPGRVLQQQQPKQAQPESRAATSHEETISTKPPLSMAAAAKSQPLAQTVSAALPQLGRRSSVISAVASVPLPVSNLSAAASLLSSPASVAQPPRMMYPPSSRPATSSVGIASFNDPPITAAADGNDMASGDVKLRQKPDQVFRSQLHSFHELKAASSSGRQQPQPQPQEQQQQQPLQQLLQQQRARLSQLDPSFASVLPTSPSSTATFNTPPLIQSHDQRYHMQTQHDKQQQQHYHHYHHHQEEDKTAGSLPRSSAPSDSHGTTAGRSHTANPTAGLWTPSGRSGSVFGAQERGADQARPRSASGGHNSLGAGLFGVDSIFDDDSGSNRNRNMYTSGTGGGLSSGSNRPDKHRSSLSTAASGNHGTNLGSDAQRISPSPSWQEAAAAAVAAAAAAAAAGAWKPATTASGLHSVSSLGSHSSLGLSTFPLAAKGSITAHGTGILAGLGTGTGPGVLGRASILGAPATSAAAGAISRLTSLPSGPALRMSGSNSRLSSAS